MIVNLIQSIAFVRGGMLSVFNSCKLCNRWQHYVQRKVNAFHTQLLAGKATAVLLKTDVIDYIDVTFTL